MAKKFIGFLLGTLFFTALLTPPVCDIIISSFGTLPYPFSRVFDRVALVCAFGMAFYYRKAFGLTNVGEGFKREFSKWKEILLGVLLSVACGVVIILYYLWLGTIRPEAPDAGYLFRKLILLLPIALLIATIEETFFRRILLKQLGYFTSLWVAVAVSSVLYAVVHFVAPLKSFEYVQGQWLTGFIYLGQVIQRMFSFELFSSMVGLWFVGIVLCGVTLRRGSLAAAIGLHAGWIICLKLVTYLTEWGPELVNASTLEKRYFIVGDLPGWICVLAVGLISIKLFPAKKETEETAV